MPQRKLFSPDDKMSDILQSNYRLLPLLPRDLRISIIDRRGNVLFDNGSDGKPIVENHLSRPEIAQALIRGGGSHIQ